MNNPNNQSEPKPEPIILQDDHSEGDDVWEVPDLTEKDLEELAEEFFGKACDPIDDQVRKDLPTSQG
jgi:hypothetical protein